MNKFLAKSFSFFVLFLFGCYLLDYIICTGLKKTEEYYFQTWTNIVESKINADVLISGNSRAFNNYCPQILDTILQVNAYNIGIGGYPFDAQYLRYRLYEKYNKKPQLIIQNIDFGTLKHYDFGHEREQVFPFTSVELMRKGLRNFGFTWLELYLPLYRYFGYQMVIKKGILEYFGIKHYNQQASKKGYKPEDIHGGVWDGSGLKNIKNIEVSCDPSVIRLFEEFLMHCKNEKIKVVLVNSPIYYKASQKIVNNHKFNSLINSLSKKYNAPYLDFTKDPICSDTANFRISVHMNKEGGELFSKKLAYMIKEMNILNASK
ncbi:MAG: hypothetical protein LH615_10855 [Ferruginibacter sp.]|nr:hypothetical protein [Ferruginibacter sp.]